MKLPLLLLLALPLSTLAQYRPIYSPTARPSYTPAPTYHTPTPYQTSVQQQQQAYQRREATRIQQLQQAQSFSRQQQQAHTQQQFQQQMQQHLLMQRRRSPQQLALDQERQQQAEDKANEQLTQLAQEQQRQQLENPAPDAQQAAARQAADAKQLNRLRVKNYREVFLPGQISKAVQSQQLSAKARTDLQDIKWNVLDNGWWNEQEPAQLSGKMAAYANTLTSLTAELLPAAPAAPAPSVSSIDDLLAKDAFDYQVADQLIQDAALAEKRLAGEPLAKAVADFNTLATSTTFGQRLQTDAQQLRKEVKASLKLVNQELQRYTLHVGSAGKLYATQKALLASTAKYLKDQEKAGGK